jgi:DNA modification methylase
MNEVGAIYTADSFKKIKEVPDHSVDVILTDPPYNLGQYSTGNLKMSWRADFNNDIAAWDQQTFTPRA